MSGMRRWLLPLAAWCGMVWLSESALGQGVGQDRTIPPMHYYSGFSWLNDGDYDNALESFEANNRSAIKSVQARWIDSICYETMCGEALFQMGRLKEALQCYTAALNIFKNYSGWMVHVQFAGTIRPDSPSARKIVPWGVSKRQSVLGRYNRTEKLLLGQIDQSDVVQKGGTVQLANLFPVTPQEIVRCTVLALRRRMMLLGPACRHDPLTGELMAAASRPMGPPNHWSDVWVCLERGLVMMAGGKESQALDDLRRSVVAGGEFDHPLTSVALLELGRHSLARGEYPAAAQFFEEATYAAVNYPDYTVLDEAFRGGMAAHLLSGGQGMFPPLESAMQWAKVNKLRQLRASLLLLAAENYAILNETRSAVAMLDEARATIGRRAMGAGWIGARLNYLTALTAFQQGRLPEGDAALATAMNYMQHGSLRLFHIQAADGLYLAKTVTPRMALDLFAEVLRDPRPDDWTSDPMESLATLLVPHPLEFEHWFESALSRSGGNEVGTAIEITDRIRRHRFLTTLELGGRLESLRWVLEAPPESLSKDALLQRQALHARFPAYRQLARQAETIRESLSKAPLTPEEPEGIKEQSRLLSELGAVGRQQEKLLREIALRREPADMAFPPLRSLAEVQKSLPAKHAVLAFFATENQMYGFLLNNERYAYWALGAPAAALKPMQALLRGMGHFQAAGEVPLKDLADAKWKPPARELLQTLLKGSSADFSQPFDELVVVPEGILWYLPFEALHVTVEGEPQPLITRFRLRYAPTLALTMFSEGGRRLAGRTAVVLGKLYPRDGEPTVQSALERLAATAPGAAAIRPPLPAPVPVYSTLLQRLIVLDDVPASEQSPYAWQIVPGDRNASGNSLGEWLTLPWGRPESILLPGFHTAAEDGLKRSLRGPPGREIFLSLCGMMAGGTRTVLLSRWRTGGQSSVDLMSEWLQELPRRSPAAAWQRAVLLTMDSRLNLDAEPRVKRAAGGTEAPHGDHPFFWAGYLLADCGAPAERAADPGDPGVQILDLVQPGGKGK